MQNEVRPRMRFCPVCGVCLQNAKVFWLETKLGRLEYERDGNVSVVLLNHEPERGPIRCGNCGSSLSEPARLR